MKSFQDCATFRVPLQPQVSAVQIKQEEERGLEEDSQSHAEEGLNSQA